MHAVLFAAAACGRRRAFLRAAAYYNHAIRICYFYKEINRTGSYFSKPLRAPSLAFLLGAAVGMAFCAGSIFLQRRSFAGGAPPLQNGDTGEAALFYASCRSAEKPPFFKGGLRFYLRCSPVLQAEELFFLIIVFAFLFPFFHGSPALFIVLRYFFFVAFVQFFQKQACQDKNNA